MYCCPPELNASTIPLFQVHLRLHTTYSAVFQNMFSSFSTRDRLRRSMSSRSIRRSHLVTETEPFDPEIAKAHATAAASRAMRSSERSSTDSTNPYDRLGGPAHVAIPRRRPNSSLQFADDSVAGCSVPIAPPATPRQSMETTKAGRNCGLADSVALPPPTTDFRRLDGRDSSVPSSYRRLRKAKSMFSTRQRPSNVAYGTPTKHLRDSCDPDGSPVFELPRTLRPSSSFMRESNRGWSRTVRHAQSQDAAIQLARSQFIDEVKGEGSQVGRSSFFTSRRKREHKPFRKTFRITSDTGIGADSPEQANLHGTHSRPRTFSASIKKGLMRVFGFSRPVEQQSESQSEEVSSDIPAESAVDSHHPSSLAGGSADTTHCNGSSSWRVTQNSPGRDSLCTSTSRVTSWADSTVANTVTTRKTGHRQSLSLIEEHGDLNQQLPQVPTSVDPVDQSFSHKRVSTRRYDDWVNSHDLYSALMQQIGRNAVHSPDEAVIFGTVPEYRVIPERTSSIYSHRSKRSIRHIPSGESTPVSYSTARRGDSSSPQRHSQSTRYVHAARTSRYSPGHEKHRPFSNLPAGTSTHPSYAIGEDSEEDTGSVVVARSGESKPGSVSPSVYSRTTGGDTPTNDAEDSVNDVLNPWAEPGTATIFASERHSSPTRVADSEPSNVQVQPSADWQQWMSSQIERIEKTSTTREHFREDAQFLEDDDHIFMGMMRRAPAPGSESSVVPYVSEPDDQEQDKVQQSSAEMKVLTENNFSRPFSRSSSLRTIVSSQKIEPSNETKHSSKLPGTETTVNHFEIAPAFSGRHPSDRVSPIRVRNTNLLDVPESPTPQRSGAELQKRTWTQEQYRRYPARRPLANGKPGSFRSMRTYRDFHGLNNENMRQQEEHDDMMDEYHRLHDMHPAVSSKHMVEMFLNSRRRPMKTDTSDGNAAGEAFL